MQHIRMQSTRPSPRRASWQRLLAEAVRDPDELFQLLDLPRRHLEAARRAAQQFPLVAPRGYIARMEPGNPNDPLLLQILPALREAEPSTEQAMLDPVGDRQAVRAPGMLQKYAGRVLFVATGVCAVHCRYCFRRHYPYQETPRGILQWEPAIREIEADPSIEEVILSGGDPLTLTDDWLARLVERLAGVQHLQRLRIHSRLPIVLPERVNSELLCWLRGGRLTPIMVVHANHPNELDETCCSALGRLVDAGVPVLNQTVLLRGINDSVEVIAELCRRLVQHRVLPYYLHQLDRVQGALHFEVPEEEGRELVHQLRKLLPGYAVPRYVREVEGDDGKRPL
jgi:EF-P beta-lysylation protein EpmB